MALLRQEARFVDHLFASGMVDEAEHEQLLKPIEKRERRMQRQGALWRVPLISEVGSQVGAPHLASSVQRMHNAPPVICLLSAAVTCGGAACRGRSAVAWAPHLRGGQASFGWV